MFPIVHLVQFALGHHVSATAKGSRVRTVGCPYCQSEYVYQVHRKAVGFAYAFLHLRTARVHAQARANADRDLAIKLQRAEACVPCPECGRLPPMMARQRRRRWLKVIGTAAALTIVPTGLIGMALAADPFTGVTLTGVGLAVGAIAGVHGIAAAWVMLTDPNRHPERHTRAALGAKCRAMTRAEFEALTGLGTDLSPLAGEPDPEPGR